MGISEHHQKEIDTHAQSSTNQLFQYFMLNEIKKDITLTQAIVKGDEIIKVSASHLFTVDEYIVVRSGDIFMQAKVISVSVNDIGISNPADMPFPIESGIIRGSRDLNVNGSSTPVDFKYTTDINGGIDSIIPIDLKTVRITMQHAAEGDDSTFGDLAALTDSFYFRKLNGENFNFGSYNQNQDFKDFGATVTRENKAGGGNWSTNIDFDLVAIFGQEVRFNPRTLDIGLAHVRSNLSSLLKFTVSLLGSFTIGE